MGPRCSCGGDHLDTQWASVLAGLGACLNSWARIGGSQRGGVIVRVLFNVLVFQIGWFACVIGGAKGLPWSGVAVTGLIVALHLSLSGAPRREALLLVIVGTIGALWDGLVHGVASS